MTTVKLVPHPIKAEELESFASVFIEELMETGNDLARTCGGKTKFEEHCVLCEPSFLSVVLKNLETSRMFDQPIEGRRDLRVQHSFGSIQVMSSTHPIRGYAVKNRPWMWSLKRPPLRDFLQARTTNTLIPTFRESMEQHLRAEVEMYSEAFGWKSDRLDVYVPVLFNEMGTTFRWGSFQPPTLESRTLECTFKHADLGGALFLARYDMIQGVELRHVLSKDPEFVKREGDW